MLLGTLAASWLGNMLAGKGIQRAGEGFITAGYGSKRFLIPPDSLTNFEIQKYYQNEPRFNGANSRNNLWDKIKDGTYVINLDKYSDIETHWIALNALNNNGTYFDSFEIEHIPKEIKIFIDKSIVAEDIFRIQVYDSIMCRYFVLDLLILCLQGRL